MAILRSMSLPDKVGQLFMVYGYGRSADDSTPAVAAANRSLFGVSTWAQMIQELHPGGVIYLGRNTLDPPLANQSTENVQDPAQIAALSAGLQSAATNAGSNVPLLISTDQEQGLVTRIGPPATQFPGNMALGATRDPHAAYEAAFITGQELRAMGINQDLAPVADVNVNPRNPVIGVRSFGSDPSLVSQMVAEQVKGYQAAGIAATAKHFPGHGDTDVDSHTGLPVIPHTLAEVNAIDLPPFQMAVKAGVDVVMSAHIIVPALDPNRHPATLSPTILGGVLRQRFGYDGVVMTDALWEAGVRDVASDADIPVLALQAGVDILLMPPNLAGAIGSVLHAVSTGALTTARIDQSVLRILELKLRLGLFDRKLTDPTLPAGVVGTPAHLAAANDVAAQSVTLLRPPCGAFYRPASSNVLVVGNDAATVGALASSLTRDGARSPQQLVSPSPGAAAAAAAAALARFPTLVFMATFDAWRDPSQVAVADALIGTRAQVTIVATGDPYDVSTVAGAATYIVTYSSDAASMAAVARVVFGTVAPTGKLPVAIPAGAGPGYPFGAGVPAVC